MHSLSKSGSSEDWRCGSIFYTIHFSTYFNLGSFPVRRRFVLSIFGCQLFGVFVRPALGSPVASSYVLEFQVWKLLKSPPGPQKKRARSITVLHTVVYCCDLLGSFWKCFYTERCIDFRPQRIFEILWIRFEMANKTGLKPKYKNFTIFQCIVAILAICFGWLHPKLSGKFCRKLVQFCHSGSAVTSVDGCPTMNSDPKCLHFLL